MFKGDYVCYVLQSTVRSDKTYVGKTNNLKRRLLQHNGRLKGGARYTKSHRPWRILFIVGGFHNDSEALKFEWAMKHHRKGRGGGVRGRYRTVAHLFNQDCATKSATPLSKQPRVMAIFACTQERFKSWSKIHKTNAQKNRKHIKCILKRARFQYKFPNKLISSKKAGKLFPWYKL